MIGRNQFFYAVNTVQKFRLQDPVARKSPLQLFLSITNNVTHRYYGPVGDESLRFFRKVVDDPPLVLPLFPHCYESLLDRNSAAYHELLSKLVHCEVEPQNCEGLAAEIIQKIFRIVCGVSERRRHLRIRCVIARKHDVIFEEDDIIGMDDEGHLILMDGIMDDDQSTLELQEEEEEERNLGMVPADPKAIRFIKCMKIEGDESGSCAICMEKFTDFAASMPCNHLFHGECIEKWLVVSHYCPICRHEMPTKA